MVKDGREKLIHNTLPLLDGLAMKSNTYNVAFVKPNNCKYKKMHIT